MNKIVISCVIALTLVVGLVGFTRPTEVREVRVGSVESTYLSKNIIAGNASTTSAVSVRGGAGVLGSVVVLKTSATVLAVYDGSATTTGATLIATLPASIAAGTYTLDVAVNKGIVLAGSVGFDGDYVITYR